MLDGAKILRETWDGNTLVPLYDNEDSVCGIVYNNTPYYFQKNLQGDVIGITDENGTVVAEYVYDAWGKVVDISGCDLAIAEINPFRYRGYYYDQCLQLYYLQSRYYDPEIGRFINADMVEFGVLSFDPLGPNIFSYCINDPCNLNDPTGHLALVDDLLIATFIGLCSLLLLLLSWVSTPEFKQSWASFCTAVGNGLGLIGTSIANGGKAAWNWTVRRVKAATVAITAYIVIARAHSKIKSKVKERSKTRYWTATLRTDYVDIGRAISYSTAVKEVSWGRNVFTVTSSEAKAVAKAAYSNKKPYGPEIHGGGALGYYYHYHVYGHKKNGHVFFLFW